MLVLCCKFGQKFDSPKNVEVIYNLQRGEYCIYTWVVLEGVAAPRPTVAIDLHGHVTEAAQKVAHKGLVGGRGGEGRLPDRVGWHGHGHVLGDAAGDHRVSCESRANIYELFATKMVACVGSDQGVFIGVVCPTSRLPRNFRTKTCEVHVDEVERSSG